LFPEELARRFQLCRWCNYHHKDTANSVFPRESSEDSLIIGRRETMVSRTDIEARYRNWFLHGIAGTGERILIVDYEAISAPSLAHQKSAQPDAEVRDRLQVIDNGCGTRLIVISSRPADEVSVLLGMKPAPEIWGDAGLERLCPDGHYEYADLAVPVETLEALAECESSLGNAGLGRITESRLSGIVVCCIGLSQGSALDARSAAYRVFQPIVNSHPSLRLLESERGVELHLRGANKGEAVRRLLALTPSHIPVAYLGNDTRDEDAFRVLNGRGLTVLVTHIRRFTAAQVCIGGPGELIAFLNDWIRACTAS
jgi:trehalose-phosphatase